MSIPEWLKKINTQALIGVSLVLAVFLGFGIVKIQASEAQKQPIFIDSSHIVTQGEKDASPASSGQVVASKAGTKYHLLTCPGAKTIAEKNRVYFASPAAAEAAGYTPASTCKALVPTLKP